MRNNTKNSFNNAPISDPRRSGAMDYGDSLHNRFYHQITANIVKALLERTYNAYGTRVFYDVVQPQTTSITFQVAAGNSDNAPADNEQAVQNFVQDMLNLCEDENSLPQPALEQSRVSNVTFNIRDVLPALRTLAAERFTEPKHISLVCGLINDLQIELHRNQDSHATHYNH